MDKKTPQQLLGQILSENRDKLVQNSAGVLEPACNFLFEDIYPSIYSLDSIYEQEYARVAMDELKDLYKGKLDEFQQKFMDDLFEDVGKLLEGVDQDNRSVFERFE